MNTDAVTLLTSCGNPVNKIFTIGEDGSLRKKMAPNNGYFAASNVPVPDLQAMAGVLHDLAGDPSLT